MQVRLAAAICGAAIMLVHLSPEVTTVAWAYSYRAGNDADTGSTRQGINRAVAVAMGDAIVGVASMYNPYRLREQEGGTRTASGERYDPDAWAAAIQIDLREKFGGVRYGKDYRYTYALVESTERKAIVKINDVGPLKPGRVIDFNERTMRYFDPALRRGLIHRVRVTPLLGDDWTAGPIEGARLTVIAYRPDERCCVNSEGN